MRKLLSVLIICCVFNISHAQFEIKDPVYAQKTNKNNTLKAIRFYPDSVTIFFEQYICKTCAGDMWLDKNNHITVNGRADKYSSKNPEGITYSKKEYKSNRGNEFSVTYPYSFAMDVWGTAGDGSLDEQVKKMKNALCTMNGFKMDIMDCDKEQAQKNSCYNYYKVDLSVLPAINWMQLWTGSIANYLLKKDEFETSDNYKRRTSADSIKFQVKGHAQVVNYILSHYQFYKTGWEKSIKYDADKQEFHIQYAGFEMLRISVPSAEARKFKEDFEANNYRMEDMNAYLNKNGKFYIEHLEYYNSSTGKTKEYSNKSVEGKVTLSELEEMVYEKTKKTYSGYFKK